MFYYFTSQDLLTSSLLSDDGHKTYHVPHRGMHSPLQVGMVMFVFIQVPNTVSCWPLKTHRSPCPFSSSYSSVPGSRRPVGKRRSTPRSRATSTSTLTLRGHWWCSQRSTSGNINARCAGHGVAGFIFVVVQQLGEASRHQCFLHLNLLDFNQQKLHLQKN